MKRAAILTLGAALVCATALRADAPVAPADGVYKVDPVHTTLGFEVRHLVVSTVHGRFDKFDGQVTVKDGKIAVEGTAQAASVDTDNPMRDAHLRGDDPKKPKDDFFDAEQYPTLTFKSTESKLDGDQLTVTGDLTLRGVTKKVTFTGTYNGLVKAPWGATVVGASLRAKINRQDFGMKFNAVLEAGPVVSNDVTLVLDVEADKVETK